MGLRDEMAADIAGEIIPELDDTAKIDGVDGRRCFVSNGSREVIFTTKGNPAEVSRHFLIIDADFETLPRSGSKVVFDGVEYKVGRLRDLHGVATWLDCIDWNSK